MTFKAGCDVESCEDFAKYYSGSYLRMRDSDDVFRVHTVSAATQQVLVQFLVPGAAEQGMLKVYPWKDFTVLPVFGKVDLGAVEVGDKAVVYMYEPSNKVYRRGFSPGNIRRDVIGGGIGLADRRVDYDEQCALAVLNRKFSPIWAYDSVERPAIALDSVLAVCFDYNTGDNIIYARRTPIGHYVQKTREAHLGTTEYRIWAPVLTTKYGVNCRERK